MPTPTGPQLHAGPPQPYPLQHLSPVPTTPTSPTSPTAFQPTGDKRKHSTLQDAHSPSVVIADDSRVTAEEDKRRRNTAASARFRAKKKQREQAIEKTAKEMTEKVSMLEAKIGQLEMENKWLKSLITEKTGAKEDVAELYRRFGKEGGARSTEARTDGVGTEEGHKAGKA